MGMVPCGKCGENVDMVELEAHIKEDLVYYPYRCPVCMLKFTTEASLRQTHFPRKHPNVPVQILANENERLETKVTELIRLSVNTNQQPPTIYAAPPNFVPFTPPVSRETPTSVRSRIAKLEPQDDNDVISLEPATNTSLDSGKPSAPTPKRRRRTVPSSRDSWRDEQLRTVRKGEPTATMNSPISGRRRANIVDSAQGIDEGKEMKSVRIVGALLKEITRESPDINDDTKAYYYCSRMVKQVLQKRSKENKPPLNCDLCDYTFSNHSINAAVDNHLIRHIKEPLYACPECDELTNHIVAHFRTKHPNQTFTTKKTHLNIRPEIVQQAIDNIFDCFPTMTWIKDMLNQEAAYERQPKESQERTGGTRRFSFRQPRGSIYKTDTAMKFREEIESTRRRLKVQSMERPSEEIKCQIEGCVFRLKDFSFSGVENHVIAHFNLPLFECSDCGEETKYLSKHVNKAHPDRKDDVIQSSKNYKAQYEKDLLHMLSATFPPPNEHEISSPLTLDENTEES